MLSSVEQTQSGSSVVGNVVDPSGAFAPSGQMPLSEMQVLGNEPDVLSPTSATRWAGTTEMQIPRKEAAPSPPPAETGTTLSSPTTLRNASGQASTSRRFRRQRWIASLAGTVAVIGAVAFIVLRGGDDASRTPPLPQRERESGAAETYTQPAAIDAGLVTATPPALAVGDAGLVVPAASDGGVSDAAPLAEVIDAAVRPVHRPKPGSKDPRQPSTGGDHDHSAGSATPLQINRND